MNNWVNHRHGAWYATLHEEEHNALSDEKAFDSITQITEACAVSIKRSLVISTAFTFVGEAKDSSNDNAGEVSTAGEAMAARATYAARPKNARGTEQDKECHDCMEKEKVRIEG